MCPPRVNLTHSGRNVSEDEGSLPRMADGDEAASDPGIRQREALLSDLFENTSDLIQLIDIEGRIELVNRAWAQALGISEAEAVGLNIFSLIAPECQEHCQVVFRELLSRGTGQRIECTFLTRDGQRIELEGQLDVASADGVPQRVRGILRDITSRRRTEQALQSLNASLEQRIQESNAALFSSEARLREAQAVAGVGHWDLDLLSGAMHWSEEICRLGGFDPAVVEPSYAAFLSRVHPGDRAQVEAANERIQDLHAPLELQFRLLHENGDVRHIHSRIITHFDVSGTAVRVIGTSQDITELVLSQRRLQESEQRLRSLVELSPFGIALISAQGQCLQSNEAFDRLCGMELDGSKVCGARAIWERLCSGLFQSESTCSTFQINLERSGGEPLPVSVLVQRIPDSAMGADGDLVWLMLEDISVRLATEQRLRQAANVFRYAEEGIMITDTEGRIIDVNAAFTRLTGYSRQEVVGLNPRLLKSGRHDQSFYRDMWQQLEDKGRWRGEVTNKVKDGSLREMLESISIVQDPDGQSHQYVALLTDIRQIKAQQQQLEQLAMFDPLTGLSNRVQLTRRLEQAMADVASCDEQIAVCFIDLDGFKQINDRLGHAAGDQLLKTVALRMNQAVRGRDMLARLGGDEFVAVLRDVDGDASIITVLDRLLKTLQEPVDWQGQPMQISASIGVCLYPTGNDILSPDQLLRHADHAMYNAKRTGKNRYIFEEEI